jgi:predicted nucleic acid-binding protein
VSPAKVVVHTDVLLGYLKHRGPAPSVLRRIMARSLCYTTVFNAIELFALARSAREKHAIAEALTAMKLLGLNAKHAPKFGAILAARTAPGTMETLVAGLCIESGLPLVTSRPARFARVKGLTLVTPEELLS